MIKSNPPTTEKREVPGGGGRDGWVGVGGGVGWLQPLLLDTL